MTSLHVDHELHLSKVRQLSLKLQCLISLCGLRIKVSDKYLCINFDDWFLLKVSCDFGVHVKPLMKKRDALDRKNILVTLREAVLTCAG